MTHSENEYRSMIVELLRFARMDLPASIRAQATALTREPPAPMTKATFTARLRALDFEPSVRQPNCYIRRSTRVYIENEYGLGFASIWYGTAGCRNRMYGGDFGFILNTLESM